MGEEEDMAMSDEDSDKELLEKLQQVTAAKAKASGVKSGSGRTLGGDGEGASGRTEEEERRLRAERAEQRMQQSKARGKGKQEGQGGVGGGQSPKQPQAASKKQAEPDEDEERRLRAERAERLLAQSKNRGMSKKGLYGDLAERENQKKATVGTERPDPMASGATEKVSAMEEDAEGEERRLRAERAERAERLLEQARSRGMAKKGLYGDLEGKEKPGQGVPPPEVRPGEEKAAGVTPDPNEDEERRLRAERAERLMAQSKNRGMSKKGLHGDLEDRPPIKTPQQDKDHSPASMDVDGECSPSPDPEAEERRLRAERAERLLAQSRNRGMAKKGLHGDMAGKAVSTPSKEKAAGGGERHVDPEDAAREMCRLRAEERLAQAQNRGQGKGKAPPSPTAASPPPPSPQQHPAPSPEPVSPIPEPELSEAAKAALKRAGAGPAGISKEKAEEMALRREKEDLVAVCRALAEQTGKTVPFGIATLPIEKIREIRDRLRGGRPE
eukprot:Sspe_Gene.88495::Locus_60497_Transcript_1_1_Confidence_1.000_Length_1639::g.88495::m.88495